MKPEPEQVVLSQAAKVDKIEESCHHDLLDSADDEALKLSESAMPIIPLVSLFFKKVLLVPKITKDEVSSLSMFSKKYRLYFIKIQITNSFEISHLSPMANIVAPTVSLMTNYLPSKSSRVYHI